MKLKFTVEDFLIVGAAPYDPYRFQEFAVDMANAKLNEWKKSWIKVYGIDLTSADIDCCFFELKDEKSYSHKAYVIEVEPKAVDET